jgi:hypothetical protein
MIHERAYRPTYAGRDSRDRIKLERLKKLSLLPLAITASLLWTKALEPQSQSQLIRGLEFAQQLQLPIVASTTIAESVILDHLDTQEYYDHAKTIFACYRAGDCKQLIETRLSKEGLEKANQQYNQGNITKQGRAFALSMHDDQDILRQYNNMIPYRGRDILDAVGVTTYVANNSWYDSAVEGTGANLGLDYVKTAREFQVQENTGDCDDTAVLSALLLSLRGIDSVMISYNSSSRVEGGFGHLVNAIEAQDPTRIAKILFAELEPRHGDDTYGIVRDIPIVSVYTQGLTKYYIILDATAIDTVQLRSNAKTQVEYAIYHDKSGEADKVIASSPLLRRLKLDIGTSSLVTQSGLTLTSLTQHGQYISTQDMQDPIAQRSIELLQLGDLIPGFLDIVGAK